MLPLPMSAFELKGMDASIALTIDEVFGYPSQISYAGGYAATGKITILVGEYAVNGAAHYFTTGELNRFYEQLQRCYETLTGTAILENAERELQLSCLFNKRGHVLVEGPFQSDPAVKTVLKFEFLSDQTQVLPLLSSLKRVKRIFGGDHGIPQV